MIHRLTRGTASIVHRFVLAALLGVAVAATAQTAATQGRDPEVDAAATMASPGADELTDGEVRKVDREAGRLTLRHGPLRNLDMPGMTMVFDVADAAVLDRLRPGERVRFQAGKVDGRFVVVRIESATSSR